MVASPTSCYDIDQTYFGSGRPPFLSLNHPTTRTESHTEWCLTKQFKSFLAMRTRHIRYTNDPSGFLAFAYRDLELPLPFPELDPLDPFELELPFDPLDPFELELVLDPPSSRPQNTASSFIYRSAKPLLRTGK